MCLRPSRRQRRYRPYADSPARTYDITVQIHLYLLNTIIIIRVLWVAQTQAQIKRNGIRK